LLRRRQAEQENQANEVPQEHNSIHSIIDLLDKFKEQMTDNEYIKACNTLMRVHRETTRQNEEEEDDDEYDDLLRHHNILSERYRNLQFRCLSMETERIEFNKYIEELEDENYNLKGELYDKDKLIEEMRKKLHELQRQLTPLTEPKNPNEDNPLYYTCQCGACIQKVYKQRHETTKKHINFTQQRTPFAVAESTVKTN
jgi:chromosome segregation ATPase